MAMKAKKKPTVTPLPDQDTLAQAFRDLGRQTTLPKAAALISVGLSRSGAATYSQVLHLLHSRGKVKASEVEQTVPGYSIEE